jgi:hypothetical protein
MLYKKGNPRRHDIFLPLFILEIQNLRASLFCLSSESWCYLELVDTCMALWQCGRPDLT